MSPQPVSLLCQYSTGILSPGEEGVRRRRRRRRRTEEGESRGEESKCRSVLAVPGH